MWFYVIICHFICRGVTPLHFHRNPISNPYLQLLFFIRPLPHVVPSLLEVFTPFLCHFFCSLSPLPLHSSLSCLVEERGAKSRSAPLTFRLFQKLVLKGNSPLALPSTRTLNRTLILLFRGVANFKLI